MCRRCTRVLGCLAHLTSSLARRISSQTSDAPLRNAIPCCATAQSEPAVKFQHNKHPTRQHARETAQHGCQPPILEQLRKLPRVGHEPYSALARARPGNDHGACSPNCRGTAQARRLLDDQRAHSEQGTIGSLSEHTCVREHTSATERSRLQRSIVGPSMHRRRESRPGCACWRFRSWRRHRQCVCPVAQSRCRLATSLPCSFNVRGSHLHPFLQKQKSTTLLQTEDQWQCRVVREDPPVDGPYGPYGRQAERS